MNDRSSNRPMMRAAVIDRFGPPELLRTDNVPVPEIADKEVLVRVEAAGINAIDWATRAGAGVGVGQFPAILGWDLSGTVVAMGSGVHDVGDGEEVFAMARFPDIAGAYAEYAAVPASDIARKPRGVDHQAAACAPMSALTAWQCLFDHAQLREGQRALIHSAAGGVGHVAVQLAKQVGAEVIATASPSNHDLLTSLGADHVAGYTDWVGSWVGDVDVVVDPRGGSDFIALLEVLRPGGIIVTLKGRQPGQDEAAAARDLRAGYTYVAPDGPTLGRIADLMQQGKLHVLVERAFDLEQAAAAHALGERGHIHGKLVLETA